MRKHTAGARIEIAHFPTDRIVATIMRPVSRSDRHTFNLDSKYLIGLRARHIRDFLARQVLLRRLVMAACETMLSREFARPNAENV